MSALVMMSLNPESLSPESLSLESLSLESLPHRQHATVAAIDWAGMTVPEARRLRELGFDEGVGVEVLHRAALGKGPIACRIGRMTVALRRAVAGAIHVSPLAPAE